MAAPGRYSKGTERRSEILAAARTVVSRDGYSGATLRQIAKELGLESAHLLYYFDSRESLLQEVLTEWDYAGGQGIDPVNSLAGWISGIARNQENPGMVQLYTAFAAEATSTSHPAHAHFQARFALLESHFSTEIARLQSVGVVAPEIDPFHSARKLIVMSDGLQLRWLIDRTIDMPAFMRRAIAEELGPGIFADTEI